MIEFLGCVHRGGRAVIVAGVAGLTLAGCEGGVNPFKARPDTAESAPEAASSVRLVERDVEAPDVFQVTDQGLWDGRPSLGGVWVAHPDVKEPERVIIRNTANGKFVIGALFRRERANPGPVLQVSSDAAAALEMLAGAPARLNVTALRREEQPDAAGTPDAAAAELAPEAVETTTLDPVAGAAAAIDAAEAEAGTDTAAAPAPAATAPAPKPAAAAVQPSALDKPYIQIGIFSVEQNAENTATAMRRAGMVPTVLEQSSAGKTFWRVIVGPAATRSERAALLDKIKGIGFDDAYAVTN
ncbi:SPOR domain-containing protein [Roseovarius sp. SCSIO 43702]|uniref:SPOR domain-containing protein n=1 Tax=Roseovarius sp. SCSIO 43702 TaxID=2823043 RepID=UPI001C73C09B|nr:SPOR domain-containing protein [Roseovarius sp. SCSIO 43702]QYX55941.1 SPOR domain-containing protein [Roseovarius sp. SCSIO 43702]